MCGEAEGNIFVPAKKVCAFQNGLKESCRGFEGMCPFCPKRGIGYAKRAVRGEGLRRSATTLQTSFSVTFLCPLRVQYSMCFVSTGLSCTETPLLNLLSKLG